MNSLSLRSMRLSVAVAGCLAPAAALGQLLSAGVPVSAEADPAMRGLADDPLHAPNGCGRDGPEAGGSGDLMRFRFRGRRTGTLGSGDFWVESVADAGTRQGGDGIYFVNHTASVITLLDYAMHTYDVFTPTRTFVNQGRAMAGYSRAGEHGLDLFTGPAGPALASWDMTTPMGYVSGEGNLLQWTAGAIETSGGVLVFPTEASPALFEATLDSRTVIDFESLAQSNNGVNPHGYQYDEDGFRFSKTPAGRQFRTFGAGERRYAGSTAMFNDEPGAVTTLRRTDRALFAITSVRLANLNGNGPGAVEFTGYYPAGGSVSVRFVTGAAGLPNTLNRYHFPGTFCRLERLEWRQNAPFHQFDSLAVSVPARLDFQVLEHNNRYSRDVGDHYDEEGYRFAVEPGEKLNAWPIGGTAYPGSTALFSQGAPITLHRLDGGPFDAFEIFVANLIYQAGPARLSFTGTRIDGSRVFFETDTGDPGGLPNPLKRRTFPSDFRLLTKLTWPQIDSSHQFDDVLVARSSPCRGCDLDLSTGIAVCDTFDFLAFQNRFAAADPYACDFDTSPGPGLCDIFDFLAFQNAFAAGCP